MVRLVKGAYWDTEIKRAQVDGLAGYPVFTRKAHTDVSYLACARALLAAPRCDLSAVRDAQRAHDRRRSHRDRAATGRLRVPAPAWHGRGALRPTCIAPTQPRPCRCRVYAPVGSHGTCCPTWCAGCWRTAPTPRSSTASSTTTCRSSELVADPVARGAQRRRLAASAHSAAARLYRPTRPQLAGHRSRRRRRQLRVAATRALAAPMRRRAGAPRRCSASQRRSARRATSVRNPADIADVVGTVAEASAEDVDAATLRRASAAGVDATPARARAALLERAADLLEARPRELHRAAACAKPARRWPTPSPRCARRSTSAATTRRGAATFAEPAAARPDRREQRAALRGRGVFVCISPWNFPLAIFTGQVAAALAAGNAVLAKPAEQTPLIAARGGRAAARGRRARATRCSCCRATARRVGAALVARSAHRGRAVHRLDRGRARDQPHARRSATARSRVADRRDRRPERDDRRLRRRLPEQVVADVLASAFDSAGQRCSALRVLCVQDDIADDVIAMLAGAMDELAVGDPGAARDRRRAGHRRRCARARCSACRRRMRDAAALLHRASRARRRAHAAPAPSSRRRDRDRRARRARRARCSGPVLHVVRYAGAASCDEVVDAINATRLRPHARRPQPHRRDGRARSSRARASATSTSTAT